MIVEGLRKAVIGSRGLVKGNLYLFIFALGGKSFSWNIWNSSIPYRKYIRKYITERIWLPSHAMSMFSNQMVLDHSTIGQKQKPAMLGFFKELICMIN